MISQIGHNLSDQSQYFVDQLDQPIVAFKGQQDQSNQYISRSAQLSRLYPYRPNTPHSVSKNVTNLILNNFNKLEPFSIIFCT